MSEIYKDQIKNTTSVIIEKIQKLSNSVNELDKKQQKIWLGVLEGFLSNFEEYEEAM